MKIYPHIKTVVAEPEEKLGKKEDILRQLALVMAFGSVFFFFIKLLFM